MRLSHLKAQRVSAQHAAAHPTHGLPPSVLHIMAGNQSQEPGETFSVGGSWFFLERCVLHVVK
jgi:hypothetical protein